MAAGFCAWLYEGVVRGTTPTSDGGLVSFARRLVLAIVHRTAPRGGIFVSEVGAHSTDSRLYAAVTRKASRSITPEQVVVLFADRRQVQRLETVEGRSHDDPFAWPLAPPQPRRRPIAQYGSRRRDPRRSRATRSYRFRPRRESRTHCADRTAWPNFHSCHAWCLPDKGRIADRTLSVLAIFRPQAGCSLDTAGARTCS